MPPEQTRASASQYISHDPVRRTTPRKSAVPPPRHIARTSSLTSAQRGSVASPSSWPHEEGGTAAWAAVGSCFVRGGTRA